MKRIKVARSGRLSSLFAASLVAIVIGVGGLGSQARGQDLLLDTFGDEPSAPAGWTAGRFASTSCCDYEQVSGWCNTGCSTIVVKRRRSGERALTNTSLAFDVCFQSCALGTDAADSQPFNGNVCKMTFVPGASCGPEGCPASGCCESELHFANSEENKTGFCFESDASACEDVHGTFLSDGVCDAANARCVPGTEVGECGDGEDNDLDEAVDCEDTDCFDAPECVAPAPALSRWGIAATILLLAAVAFVGLRRRQVRLLFLSMFWGVASKV